MHLFLMAGLRDDLFIVLQLFFFFCCTVSRMYIHALCSFEWLHGYVASLFSSTIFYFCRHSKKIITAVTCATFFFTF